MELNNKIDLDNLKVEDRLSEAFVDKRIEESDKSPFSFSQLLKDTGRQSLKAVKWFLIVFVLFIPIHIGFNLYIIFKLNQLVYPYLTIIVSLTISFIAVFFGFMRVYRFLLVDTLSIAYRYLTPLFRKISIKIIDSVILGGNKLTGRDINKSLNVGALMLEIYGNKAPKYVQKGLVFAINKIPFSNFLKNMQKDLSERKDSKTLSEILYLQIDNYMITMFKENTVNSIYLTLLISVILQIAVIVVMS